MDSFYFSAFMFYRAIPQTIFNLSFYFIFFTILNRRYDFVDCKCACIRPLTEKGWGKHNYFSRSVKGREMENFTNKKMIK